MARVNLRLEVGELFEMEQEKKHLEERIEAKRAALLRAMRLGQEVPYDSQTVFAKLDRETWKIPVKAVYDAVGPHRFPKFVNSVSIPKVRAELGERWVEKHGESETTPYVTWIHVKK